MKMFIKSLLTLAFLSTTSLAAPVVTNYGEIIGGYNYKIVNDGTTPNKFDITSMKIGFLATPSDWAEGRIVLKHSDTLVKVDEAFLTIGGETALPFSVDVGKLVLPFGNYDSYMLTDTATSLLGKINEKAVVFRMQDIRSGLIAKAYIFQGNSDYRPKDVIKHGGFDVSYTKDRKDFSYTIGGGFITDINASIEAQDKLFNKDIASNIIFEKTTTGKPGINLYADLTYNRDYHVKAEYVGSLYDFGISHNGIFVANKFEKAKPSAIQIEAAMDFKIKKMPANIAIGSGKTYGMASTYLPLPDSTSFVVGSVEIIKDVTIGLEYRYDRFPTVSGIIFEGRENNNHTFTAQAKLLF